MDVVSFLLLRKITDLKFPILILLVCLSFVSQSQEKCGTQQFNDGLSDHPKEEIKTQFENWLGSQITVKKALRNADVMSETVYQIPVVVHVVHDGESEGVGANIPEAQILNQIDSLNNDFRRLNADQENTPDFFLDDAADVKIEFVLAKKNPEGLPTDGIVRVKGNQGSFTINESSTISENSYWPAEEYFNIWVTDLGGALLGFAKFPVSNEPGMDEDPNLNRLIDGVFVDYRYFGTGENADDFSKGRTLTHEIGHWLGLRHIWGDGGCGADDFCTDTPSQGGSTSGCPDESETSCSTIDMFQNYMDYTDDECMNLFTNCQADRMRIVLESSPRRKDLLSSNGLEEVVQVANDLGLKAIVTPSFGNCSQVLVPELEVRNYGTNTINSFSLDLLVDEEVIETKSFSEPLTELQSIFVSFSSISVPVNTSQISFKVNQVNDGSDGNEDNDCIWVSTFFPGTQDVPYFEEFTGASESGNTDWRMKNSNDNPSAWNYGTAPNLTLENEAAILSYFGAPSGSFGELVYLISPVFDLTGLSTADLKFKYAYSGYPDNYSDALTVVVSTDCGATFPEDNILYQKIGASLATTTNTSSLFIPEDPSDWLEVELNFGEFSNNSEVVVAFIGNNGGGNNLYLDDVEVFSSAANNYDLGIVRVDNVPMVTCHEDIDLQVYVKNFGKQTVTDFTISYEMETRDQQFDITDLSLESGKTEVVEVESFNIEDGSYEITIATSMPNGNEDEDNSNDVTSSFFIIDNQSEFIPVRERFSRTLESSDWHFIRKDAPSDWELADFTESNVTNYAAVFKSYEQTSLGIENWLVSPILDFSETDVASMIFDVSYANKVGRNDQLKVLASTNCGRTFDRELYSKKGGELAVAQSETEWIPESDEDWRSEFIELNDLTGQNDVRLAFVVVNQNGNNIYLDNIELYVSDDPSPLEIAESMRSFPNPASDHIEVKFNFNIKEELLIRVVGLNGEVVAEKTFPNTLNQTYRIDGLNVTNNGLYIIQALGSFTNLSSKVFIIR